MFGRRRAALPQRVLAAVGLDRGEQAIAWAVDDQRRHIVATTFRVLVVRDDAVALERPWHEVDSGSWDPHTWTLTVSWVDRGRAAQWAIPGDAGRFPEAFRERVQATVLASEALQLAGPRRSGRVVLRKNLATQEVFVQTVLGRATPAGDPEVRREIERLSVYLGEQVGL